VTQPVRIQRSRAKGARLTSLNELPIVVVSRPSKYGNPYRVNDSGEMGDADARAEAVMLFATALRAGKLRVTVDDVRRELRGKNLACWCRIPVPCHADVLIEIANKR
jgi:hypothetical protein